MKGQILKTPTLKGKPMISLCRYQHQQLIIVEPNRSANWQQNKQLLYLTSGVCLIVALLFALSGAWLVIPFAGLEIIALSVGLYHSCQGAHRRHVLRFDNRDLTIEKGSASPQQVWQFPKTNTSIRVQRQPHPFDPLKIFLSAPGVTLI